MSVSSSRQADSSTRYRIRAVQPQDLYEIAGILVDSFPLTPPFLPWLNPIIRMGIHEDLRGRLRAAAPNYVCLVAIDTTQPVDRTAHLVGTVEIGTRSANPWQPNTNQYIYLSNLAVRQETRRQGIAEKLLQVCDQYVTDWGFREIYLHVLETNEPAKQLYFKAGYQIDEVQPSWNSFLFGQPKRLFLKKDLRSVATESTL